MTDRKALWIIFSFFFLVYLLMFSPRHRFDSIRYTEVARSVVFDGDLNSYNENHYFSEVGWQGFEYQPVFQGKRSFVQYVKSPDLTDRGYLTTWMPFGCTLFWIPPHWITRTLISSIKNLSGPDILNDGYSSPFVLGLAFWNLLWWLMGLGMAYRLLRRFFDEKVSLLSIMAIMGGGNLLPFVMIDICFTHAIDFFLVTAFLEMHFRFQESRDRKNVLLLGIVAGLNIIVRYQSIVLLLFPAVEIAADLRQIYRREKVWGDSLKLWTVFTAGVAIIVGLQLTYWKIMYGFFFLMGDHVTAVGIPIIDYSKLHILPMFFSKFHGLFTWMPLLLPAVLGIFLLPALRRRMGWILIAIFALIIVSNAARANWFNLGFGVRRFSSYFIIFMLGAANLLRFINRKWLFYLVSSVIGICIIWNILFMMQHYLPPETRSDVYQELTANLQPFQLPEYGWVGPLISAFPEMFRDGWKWVSQESFLMQLVSGTGNIALGIRLWGMVAVVLFFAGPVILIMRFGGFSPVRSHHRGILIALCLMATLGSYAGLAVMDHQTRTVEFAEIRNGKLTGNIRNIRLHRGRDFTGMNDAVELTLPEKNSLEFSPPVTGETITLLVRYSRTDQKWLASDLTVGVTGQQGESVLIQPGPDMFSTLTSDGVRRDIGRQDLADGFARIELPVTINDSVSMISFEIDSEVRTFDIVSIMIN